MLRFERGAAVPPEPPVPITLIDGHLHYYRYQVGGQYAVESDLRKRGLMTPAT